MKPRIIPLDASLDALHDEIVHSLALLEAYPFVAPQAAQFRPLLTAWEELARAEIQWQQAEAEAHLAAVRARLEDTNGEDGGNGDGGDGNGDGGDGGAPAPTE